MHSSNLRPSTVVERLRAAPVPSSTTNSSLAELDSSSIGEPDDYHHTPEIRSRRGSSVMNHRAQGDTASSGTTTDTTYTTDGPHMLQQRNFTRATPLLNPPQTYVVGAVHGDAASSFQQQRPRAATEEVGTSPITSPEDQQQQHSTKKKRSATPFSETFAAASGSDWKAPPPSTWRVPEVLLSTGELPQWMRETAQQLPEAPPTYPVFFTQPTTTATTTTTSESNAPTKSETVGEACCSLNRLLEEEGRGYCEQDALRWRRRCVQLEKYVCQLLANQTNGVPRMEDGEQRRPQHWREEGLAAAEWASTYPAAARRPSLTDRPMRRRSSWIHSAKTALINTMGVAPSLDAVPPSCPREYWGVQGGDNDEGEGDEGEELMLRSVSPNSIRNLSTLLPSETVSPAVGGVARTPLAGPSPRALFAPGTGHYAAALAPDAASIQRGLSDVPVAADRPTPREELQGTPPPPPPSRRGGSPGPSPAWAEAKVAMQSLARKAQEHQQTAQRLQQTLRDQTIRCEDLETTLLGREEQLLCTRAELEELRAEDKGQTEMWRGRCEALERRVAELESQATPAPATASPAATPRTDTTAEWLQRVLNKLPMVSGDLAAAADGAASYASELTDQLMLAVQRDVEARQAVRVAELQAELEVVRADRNELIGGQGDQVRLLQEQVLTMEREKQSMMERIAHLEEDRQQWRRTTAAAEANPPTSAATSSPAAPDLDALPALEARLRKEKEECVGELQRILQQTRAGADATQQAQRRVFMERLQRLEEDLQRTRSDAVREYDAQSHEISRLTRELSTARSALEQAHSREASSSRLGRSRDARSSSRSGDEPRNTVEVGLWTPSPNRMRPVDGHRDEVLAALSPSSLHSLASPVPTAPPSIQTNALVAKYHALQRSHQEQQPENTATTSKMKSPQLSGLHLRPSVNLPAPVGGEHKDATLRGTSGTSSSGAGGVTSDASSSVRWRSRSRSGSSSLHAIRAASAAGGLRHHLDTWQQQEQEVLPPPLTHGLDR